MSGLDKVLKAFDAIGLKPGEYAIQSTGSMQAHGMDVRPNDYDVIVAPDAFDRVSSNYAVKPSSMGHPSVDLGDVELFRAVDDNLGVVERAREIDGRTFSSIEDTLAFKRELAKSKARSPEKAKKDIEHIKMLIERRKTAGMNRHSQSAGRNFEMNHYITNALTGELLKLAGGPEPFGTSPRRGRPGYNPRDIWQAHEGTYSDFRDSRSYLKDEARYRAEGARMQRASREMSGVVGKSLQRMGTPPSKPTNVSKDLRRQLHPKSTGSKPAAPKATSSAPKVSRPTVVASEAVSRPTVVEKTAILGKVRGLIQRATEATSKSVAGRPVSLPADFFVQTHISKMPKRVRNRIKISPKAMSEFKKMKFSHGSRRGLETFALLEYAKRQARAGSNVVIRPGGALSIEKAADIRPRVLEKLAIASLGEIQDYWAGVFADPGKLLEDIPVAAETAKSLAVHGNPLGIHRDSVDKKTLKVKGKAREAHGVLGDRFGEGEAVLNARLAKVRDTLQRHRASSGRPYGYGSDYSDDRKSRKAREVGLRATERSVLDSIGKNMSALNAGLLSERVRLEPGK